MATAPLYGDPANKAPVWSKYAVLLGSLTATIPTGPAAFTLNDPGAGTPVTTQWDPVGALTEDDPFTDGEETIDVSPHTAAGFGTYLKTYKNQEFTIQFNALETTLVTLGLLWDASGLTTTAGNISGKLKQRDPNKKFKIAFHRENGTQMERRISTGFATLDNISNAGGDGRSVYNVTAFISPTANRELFDYYLGALS